MHPIIAKTFGGLSRSYYVRHFIFGMLFPVLIYMAMSSGKQALPLGTMAMFVVNTLLYPYSRFVYESIMSFILGRNVFFVNAVLMLAFKAATMAICWVCANFIAPIGLAYLYFHHSKAQR